MTACSASKEEVTEAARAALAQMFSTTPETKNLGLVVGRVTLVTVEPHKVFDGMALITRGDQSREVPIHVISDGEHVMVTPDNGVLALLLDPDPTAAVLEEDMAQAVAEMDAAVAEMDVAMKELSSDAPAPSKSTTTADDVPGTGGPIARSGRFVSNSGNAMLILPAHDGRSAAVLQLGVNAQAHCVEGDVSCVALGGEIKYNAEGARWIGVEGPSRCEIALRLHKDAIELLPLEAPCAGFGTANAHLGAGIAGAYAFDSSVNYAPSYPCAKASTAVEKTICATPVLGFLDRSLNQHYKQHIADSADIPAIRREQLAWVAERDQCLEDGCLMNTYLDRLYRLR